MITEATPQQKAAVIGFWRMGANYELIEMVTGIHYNYLVRIILDYEKKLNHEENNCKNRPAKKIGTTVRLSDPNPDFSTNEVLQFYSGQYPELTTATLDGPKTDGNKAVYSVKTTVGTKG